MVEYRVDEDAEYKLIKKKVALVTGGAGGIGFAVGGLLLEQGYTVVFADIGCDIMKAKLCNEFPQSISRAHEIDLDVSDWDAYHAQAKNINDNIGSVSVVVNCAGVTGKSTLGSQESRMGWNRDLSVNLTGSYNVISAFIDQLKISDGASIIDISSVVGLRSSRASEAGYTASKGGVQAMTRQLCRDLASDGIRVNCIAPGYIATQLLKDNAAKMQEWMDMHCPMGRLGQPREIAEAVAFLVSEKASYISGVVLPVDGGYLCV